MDKDGHASALRQLNQLDEEAGYVNIQYVEVSEEELKRRTYKEAQECLSFFRGG
ncbi:MAG: hypothetical protein WC998_00535 [Candidatus Paceibacterota bacterium]